MSFFDRLEEIPPDPVFGIDIAFRKDARKEKYTFVTGYYLNEQLVCPVLDTVAEVEKEIAALRLPRTYLSPFGEPGFVAGMKELIFGKGEKKQIVGAQAVGGTAALYLAGRLSTHWTGEIAISDPTWENHWAIYQKAGLKTLPYPYYKKGRLLFKEMVQAFERLPPKTAVLIHTSSHNPTGMDLSHEQWKEVADCAKKKHLFPILDMAYQGMSGTCEEDAFPARLFLERGLEFAVTYTGAKNFSLYSERVGAVFFVTSDPKVVSRLEDNVRKEVRGVYSNPPLHGAVIVKMILESPEKKARWEKELEKMRRRIQHVRKEFYTLLTAKDPSTDWSHLLQGKGLFFCTELSPEKMETLRSRDAMYVGPKGRINLTGINEHNLEKFVDALLRVYH